MELETHTINPTMAGKMLNTFQVPLVDAREIMNRAQAYRWEWVSIQDSPLHIMYCGPGAYKFKVTDE